MLHNIHIWTKQITQFRRIYVANIYIYVPDNVLLAPYITLTRLLLFRCKLAKENMLVLHDYMHQPLTHCNSTCLFPWPHCSYLLLVSRWILVFYKNGQICFECAEDKTTLNIFLPSLLLLFFFVLTLPWLCILINN